MTNEHELSARRWNALLSSGRLRILWKKGFNERSGPWKSYRCMGMELWSQFGEATIDNAPGRAILNAYTNTILSKGLKNPRTDFNDAARWDALLSSPRIGVLGTAGFKTADEQDYFRHAGIEFWTISRLKQGEHERAILTQYADTIIRWQAS